MVQPNGNGVYPQEAAERIAYPGAKEYLLYCEIFALPVDGVWLGAYSYQIGGSDLRGGGGPLMKRAVHPDRQSCVEHEAKRLLRSINGSDCKQAPKIRAWLEGLIAGPVQADLFAEA